MNSVWSSNSYGGAIFGGIGHNLFTYHRGPNGLITELFAELDQMKDEALGYFDPRPWHEDRPQRPKQWTFESGAEAPH